MSVRYHLLMPLVILNLAIPLATVTAHASTCGQLFAVHGTVEILRYQEGSGRKSESTRYYSPGKNFAPLLCDDVVITRDASSAAIEVSRGKIAIGPNARLEIAEYSGAGKESEVKVLNLLYGRVRALINKKQGPSDDISFRIHTHAAVVGVRGTDFYVSYDPIEGKTEQATIQGKVEVTPMAPSVDAAQPVVAGSDSAIRSVLVSAGQEVLVSEKQADTVNVKPIEVSAISEPIKEKIRATSVIAKNDKDFTSVEAVRVLGDPKKWQVEKEDVPAKYRDLKNEY
jgi:hypothetical protein